MRKKREYESFEKMLRVDFGTYPPSSKRELSVLMMNQKYRIVKKDGQFIKDKPTQKQLNYAWDYLKRINVITEQRRLKVEEYDYKRVIYNNKTYYIANKKIKIGKKTYRKGQFIPKPKK